MQHWGYSLSNNKSLLAKWDPIIQLYNVTEQKKSEDTSNCHL